MTIRKLADRAAGPVCFRASPDFRRRLALAAAAEGVTCSQFVYMTLSSRLAGSDIPEVAEPKDLTASDSSVQKFSNQDLRWIVSRSYPELDERSCVDSISMYLRHRARIGKPIGGIRPIREILNWTRLNGPGRLRVVVLDTIRNGWTDLRWAIKQKTPL